MILDRFPTADEFYKNYWNKKPFIVRHFIPAPVIDELVDGGTLAGFALEDEIKSRFITNNKDGVGWECQHGPFDEDHFNNLGKENWSLMVQNVEQYHPDTAKLLSYFQFSPRWLIDDIMVSFSAPGGSVGPHTDSYHTFLVQGIGKREWKISDKRIDDDCYIDNADMKILENGFQGEIFEVTVGDVIYMPPFFGHEGRTLETAMTFSVGFLGPKVSEILGDYAHYLEENEALNTRYFGDDLDLQSGEFFLSPSTQKKITNDVIAALRSDGFEKWMAGYFSVPSHERIEGMEIDNEKLSAEELFEKLQKGEVLTRPEYLKITITKSSKGGFYVSAYGDVIDVPATQNKMIECLNNGCGISLEIVENSSDKNETMKCITLFYNFNIISF